MNPEVVRELWDLLLVLGLFLWVLGLPLGLVGVIAVLFTGIMRDTNR